MPEAFICDAVRTPIGRYAGALAKVRTDDLAAVPLKALMARNPKVDWTKLDEVYFGCANQAGEDNRNVARMALLLAGLPDNVPGVTRQPAVRLGPQCGRRGRAGDPRGRHRFRDRRRRRVDDARAASCMGKAHGGVLARGRDLRHHHRLALHQSADEEAVRRRCDAGDRRERRRGIPGDARRPGRLRVALAAARRQGDRGRLLRRGDRAGRDRAARPAGDGRRGRASAARHHARRPGQAEDAVPRSRHRDGRQRVGRQRRRGRDDHRVGSGREGARADAARAHHRHGVGRRAAAHHGHRPGAGDAAS